MASKFGVQLKQTDGKPGESSSPKSQFTPGGARRSEIKPKPVSDLKAMFNQKDQEAKASIEILTKNSKVVTDEKHEESTTTYSKTVNTDLSGLKGNTKLTSSSTSTTKTKVTKQISNSNLTEDDKMAFEALKLQLKTTKLEDLDSLETKLEPKVAVSKTFSGSSSFQSTVTKKKVQNSDDSQDSESKVPKTKDQAASILSFGLTKLRTRPLSINNEEKSGNEGSKSGTASPRSQSPKPSSPLMKEFGKDRFIPGAAKGWKSAGSETSKSVEYVNASAVKSASFTDSAVGKICSEELSDSKVKGYRPISPVTFRRSSDESSSGSANLSPRGYKPPTFDHNVPKSKDVSSDYENFKSADAGKSDKNVFRANDNDQTKSPAARLKSWERKIQENKTVSTSKLESSSSSQKAANNNAPKLSRPNSKPKLTAVEQLALDKDKLKTNRNSGSFSSDSEKGTRSPKVRGDFKWMEKSRISLEEFKEQTKTKSPVLGQGQGHRPLSRASSSGSSSSSYRSEKLTIQSRQERFASPELGRNTPSPKESSPVLRKSELGIDKVNVSRSSRIHIDKFKDIKKGFEEKLNENRSQSPSANRKPMINIKTEKKLLERKQSFDSGEVFRQRSYERTEIVSPRDRGSVLKTVRALAEMDAKSKAAPNIIRRTQSLPSDSLEEENDSSADYYDDVGPPTHYPIGHQFAIGDDVSNEGDLSSDADGMQIYEEIPAAFSGNC